MLKVSETEKSIISGTNNSHSWNCSDKFNEIFPAQFGKENALSI